MNLRVSKPFLLTLPIACSLGISGCGTDTAETTTANPIPVINVALDRGYTENLGLVLNLDNHGWPNRSVDPMDPVINEARRFYDTLQSPTAQVVPVEYPNPFTGAPGPYSTKTAPLTLDQWKTTFNIPLRAPDESMEAYRARTGTVVYYNKNELGLGRELGCAEFDDGLGPTKLGVACYVTNYGTMFRDTNNSLRLAAEGLHSKNTVCITYRPSAAPGYEVQFYTYNGDGDRREWAQLDTLGPRPLPQVCMNCHGGVYDNEKHLAKYARFLPMDPNVVLFSQEPGVRREDLEERIRTMNELSTHSPLTPAQREMLDKLYGGQIAVAGTKSKNEWFPTAWNDTQEHRDLFDKVVKPNCETCHMAMQTDALGNTLAIYNSFKSPSSLMDAGLQGVVCGNFAMPNSQATRLNFWELKPEVILASGKSYDSPSEVLLEEMGINREQCQKLSEVSNCNRNADPDALCGNSFSGQACNRITGKCFPELGPYAPPDRSMPNGVCKLDGTRNCPYPQKCTLRPANNPAPEGIEGYDGVCLPDSLY